MSTIYILVILSHLNTAMSQEFKSLSDCEAQASLVRFQLESKYPIDVKSRVFCTEGVHFK